jgi:hypothetical protein
MDLLWQPWKVLNELDFNIGKIIHNFDLYVRKILNDLPFPAFIWKIFNYADFQIGEILNDLDFNVGKIADEFDFPVKLESIECAIFCFLGILKNTEKKK